MGARAAAENNPGKIFPFVHTPDAAKQRVFREMGRASHVKSLDSWPRPLASIEFEGTSMTLQAKERRSVDGQ